MGKKPVKSSTPTPQDELSSFCSALRAAIMVCSKDDLRLALNSIRLIPKATSIELQATDGHRLLVVTVALHCAKLGSIPFQISRADAIRALKVLTIGKASEVSIETKLTAKNVLIGAPDAKLRVRVVDAQFPPIESIIPEKSKSVDGATSTGLAVQYIGELAVLAKLIHRKVYARGVRLYPPKGALDPVRFDITSEERGISATYVLMPMRMPDDD